MRDLPALLDAILVHHTFLRGELDRLDAALVGAPRPIAAPFAHFRRTMIEHMDLEESEIFPAIRAFAEGRVGPAEVPTLNAERDTIGTFEVSLREAARDAGPLEFDLLAMLDDLAEHVRKEDDELVPAVAALKRARSGHAGDAPRATPTPTPPPPAPSPTRGRVGDLVRRMWRKAQAKG